MISKEELQKLEASFNQLVKKRAGIKSRITAALKNLQQIDVKTLTEETFSSRNEDVMQFLHKIDELNEQIIDLFDDASLSENDDKRVQEMDNQVAYRVSITDKLGLIATAVKRNSAPPNKNANEAKSAVKMPKLQCTTFSGKSSDKLEFKNFLQQFNNCIDVCDTLSGAAKLTYLRSYLTDYALKTISHLSIADDNYDVAMKLLKEEYLDEQYIIEEIFKQLLSKHPKFDTSFVEVRMYINECRALLYELKTYKVDLLDDNSAGCKLISHIIFSKLPKSFVKELIHKIDSNYPTVLDLFEFYNEIIKTLVKTTSKYSSESKDSVRPKTGNGGKTYFSSNNVKPERKFKPSTLENFETTVTVNEQGKFCKFCATQGHSMVSCTKYNTVEARKARCRELKLCFCCTSYKHLSDKCPGKENKLSFPCYFCKQSTHISALCPEFKGINPVATHLCLNMGASCSYQPYLLPVISLNIRRGKTSQRVRCLIDDGSQRSYLSEEVANMLGCGDDNWSQLHYDVNTFLGSSKKAFKECIMDVEIPGFKSLPLPILVDTEFAVQFQVSDLEVALENIKTEGHKLIDPCLAEQGNTIKVQGLLGVDIIQFFPKMEKIRCMHGSAWLLNTGIVPFGNIMHFLHPSQIRNTVQANVPDSTSTNFVSAVERYGSKDCDTLVNYVLEPKKTYFSPLEETFPESSVEQGLEKMFSLESVGCSETSEDQSKYDSLKIEEFKANIKYDDHKYSVVLPWHDKIEQVPSNANVAIAILNKVVGNLKEKGQLKAYQDVFAKQLSDNIIEKIDVDPESFHKHVWIPHRPIVRTDPNITTKIRPVFNCSLKVNDKPSLNEAAYAGVNLMADLTKLVLYFRSNRYVMLGDIKQAFLQIELTHEEDKNRFSFFMIENDRLVAYRYRTIIFGFNASPFILNYVIKHHASKYPDDECTRILLSNFYVDNLIITGDSEEKLGKLYKECSSRMKEGGFLLRSWNSNSKELQKVFAEDEVVAQHNNSYEKV